MLTIILNWIYIVFTAFCMGYAFAHFSEKRLKYRFKEMNTVLITGIVIATVYAELFSLFYRVNVEANLLMTVFCVLVCIVLRRGMWAFLRGSFQSCSTLGKVMIPVLFLLWAYYTSRGYRVPDMDLYHGQSIRWIEEYGVVKGLGNLHTRFGYNSSLFAVSALYSMKFLLGRSMHAVNGLLGFVMSLEVLKLGRAVKRRSMRLSDYGRIGLFYYMSLVVDEILAPSSDYAVMFLLFFVVIKWLAQLEAEKEGESFSVAPYALLCVAGVYTLTLKVTAGLILLLLIKPAYRLLKEKRYWEIGICLALGLAVAIPWFARNVIITGWLLYPFPALDLFDVPWKMTNVSIINGDAALIKIYARGLREVGINVPMREWIPIWFESQLTLTEKLLVLGDWLACLLVVGIAAWTCIRRRWENLDVLLVLATVCACFGFWQVSAPMMRYGYTHALLLAVLTYGYLLEKADRVLVSRTVYAALALFVAYRVYAFADTIRTSWWHPTYVWQETYESYDMEEQVIGGVTFYVSLESGLSGYDIFPAAPSDVEGTFELLGENLEDGFRCTED